MSKTQIRGNQILDHSITQLDVNFSGSTLLNNITTGDTLLIVDGIDTEAGVKRLPIAPIAESLRSNINVTNGGTISVNYYGGENYVFWNNVFRVISNGRGNDFSTTGFFDIECPIIGLIEGVGGAPSVSATTYGIPLLGWQVLYYVLPISNDDTSLLGNFKIASYTSNIDIPHNWIQICVVNNTNGVYYFPQGIKLKSGEGIDVSLNDSMNAHKIDGWHLSDITGNTYTNYVNVTGDTMSGRLSIGGSGLQTDFVQYNTGSTPTLVPGMRRWNDSYGTTELMTKSNSNVILQDGQELHIYGRNTSGALIPNGSAVTITGSSGDYDSFILAIASDSGNINYRVNGVATEDIPNGSLGYITYFGQVHDINLTGFSLNEEVYLSQTQPGKLVRESDLDMNGRTSQIGKVINNTVNGVLRLNIRNEFNVSNNTLLQQNVLNANDTSTGLFDFSGITITSPTTFNVTPAKGWIVDNETNPTHPTAKYISYSGTTGLTSPYLTGYSITYLMVNSSGNLVMQPTTPTPQERREKIYLGKIGHADKANITVQFQTSDTMLSPISQLRDMFTIIPIINDSVYPYFGTGLTMYNTAGTIYGMGINFSNDKKNPNSKGILASTTGTTFQYRTQTGGTAVNRTTIVPNLMDVNGALVPIGSPAKQATNQRIYLLQDGSFRIQFGQTAYNDLTAAKAAILSEPFVPFPFFKYDAILIGILSVETNAANLNDPLSAQLYLASKFGETTALAAAASITTITLQQAYNNSLSPEITTNSTLGALTLKRGSSNETDNVIEVQNTSSIVTAGITGEGKITANSFIKTGGTADQFLMANGSVITTGDTQTYYDSRYVNVNGDTMTGDLIVPNLKVNTYEAIGNLSSGGTITTSPGTSLSALIIPYLNINQSLTGDSGTRYAGLVSRLQIDGTMTGNKYASASVIDVSSGVTTNITQLRGSQNTITHSGTGTLSNAFTNYFALSNESTGTISNGYGLYGAVNNATGGTITSSYGIYGNVLNPTKGTVGTGTGGYFYTSNGTAGSNTTSVMTNMYGVQSQVWNSSNTNTTNQYGYYGIVVNFGTGTTSTAYGSSLFVQNGKTGVITKAIGQAITLTNSLGGTITTAKGLSIDVDNSNASGSIGTVYGISIGGASDDTWTNSGTITNSYGIYLGSTIDVGTTKYSVYSDSSSPSYFKGSIGIGTTGTTGKLNISDISTSPRPVIIEQGGTGDAAIQFSISGATNWIIGADNSDGDKFKIVKGNDLSTSPESLVIDTSTNNIGIGINNPSYKLHVSGDTFIDGRITGTTIVKSGGAADQYLMADGTITTSGNTTSYYDSRYVNTVGDRMTGQLYIDANFQVSGNSMFYGNISLFGGSLGDSVDSIPLAYIGNLNVKENITYDGYLMANSAKLTGLTGDTVIYQVDKTIGTAAYIDYVVWNSSTLGYRAGTIISVWDSVNDRVEFTETGTNDLFSTTSNVNFICSINGSNFEVVTDITSGTWNIKLGVRLL